MFFPFLELLYRNFKQGLEKYQLILFNLIYIVKCAFNALHMEVFFADIYLEMETLQSTKLSHQIYQK